MKHIAFLLIAAGLLAAAPAQANLELAKKSNCMSCHTVEKKLVGPAYVDVAKKYAGDKDAVKALAGKVKAGSKGVWGQISMPPNATLKDADAETLVKWILAGAK
ncbi:MAG: c-type cytochrome [Dechloromonas sp.]|uniref:C-type cytochrome n=1 Tax=Candidatus Dechloromonas phosphorivorans TaxID=2899244 RepID=A0A935JZ60_9RHOO|nr:c-type cytochrome [Candidatus Dechloromonas phosphorivorans]